MYETICVDCSRNIRSGRRCLNCLQLRIDKKLGRKPHETIYQKIIGTRRDSR